MALDWRVRNPFVDVDAPYSILDDEQRILLINVSFDDEEEGKKP